MEKETQLTKVFVARMLGSEPTWKVGDEVTFTFTYRYIRNKWQLTLRREEDIYAPYKYALRGKKLLHDGQPTEYTATYGRRYTSMEQAFLHIVNRFNDNANIRDHYKTIDQWLNEAPSQDVIAA